MHLFFISARLVEQLFYSIYPLIKPLIDIYHLGGELLEGLVDEGVGHLFVVGIGHGAGDGS